MGTDCCSNKTLDAQSELDTAKRGLRPCDTQQIGNVMYHSDDMIKIVRLQRRVRHFIKLRKAIQQYLEASPGQLISDPQNTVLEILS